MNNLQTLNRWTAFILIFEGLLMFVPLIILGSAIEWPATLSDPANLMLPRIHEQAESVRLGYFFYLMYSILFLPLALMTNQVVSGGKSNILLTIATGFGIGSAVLRTLGIIRWLFPLPVLARLYVDPATSGETRATISIVYQTLNDYAGAIGEVLGVSLFAAIWVALVSIAILRSGSLPRWIGYFGLIASLALSSALLELFGIDLGAFISVTVAVIHFWFFAVGGYLLFRNPMPDARSTQPVSAFGQ